MQPNQVNRMLWVILIIIFAVIVVLGVLVSPTTTKQNANNGTSSSTDLYRPIKTGGNVLVASAIPKYLDIGNLNFEGKYEEAIKYGEELLKKNVDKEYAAGIYINLMVSYFKLRAENSDYLQKSSDCAKQAILLGHDTGYAHERLAINLEKMGAINQAIQLCDIILNAKFKFSKNGCGSKPDFVKRRERLIKKRSKALDSPGDSLFTEQEIRSILK